MGVGKSPIGGIFGAEGAIMWSCHLAAPRRLQPLHLENRLESARHGSNFEPSGKGWRRARSCNPAEHNYSSFEGECLAVVWATSHFRPYLFGNSFHLVTDHEPLKWIMTTTKLTGKLARWSLLLQKYDFTVEHRKGVENTNVDCGRFSNIFVY